MRQTSELMHAVVNALCGIRQSRVTDEIGGLHPVVKRALTDAGLHAQHEAVLGRGCRADFLVNGSIVVEIKQGRPRPGALQTQLERYARSPGITGIVVVTHRAATVPSEIAGVPISTVILNALWGVAV